jgi:hypothetical protein
MLDRLSPEALEIASEWMGAFGAALARGSADALSELFAPDSHWRNLFGISWHFATFSGRERLVRELTQRASEVGATGFRIDTSALTPRRAGVAGRDVIEAVFAFDTVNGPCTGAVRLLPAANGLAKAWTISTSLDFDRLCQARSQHRLENSHIRDFAGPDWAEQRQRAIAYGDREPDVLIVGGGHAGISVAVELKRIGLKALIVDRMARVGDNWRLRYRGLKLHNKTPVNHLRYLPFPETFPDYIPKDKIANWLESYVDIMEVDFWTSTGFEGAVYDEATQRWSAVRASAFRRACW